MQKGLIAFIVIACVALVIMFMKQSARIARKKSDDITEQFKTVDKDLHKATGKRPDTLNKMNFDSLIKANK
jgi:hypothetical protein